MDIADLPDKEDIQDFKLENGGSGKLSLIIESPEIINIEVGETKSFAQANL
jgi:hypothetical protein